MTVSVHDDPMCLGQVIRGHRIRVGMTQRQLADFSTVSVRAIRDLERGATLSPRRETLRLIADTLRLDASARSDLERAAGRVRAKRFDPAEDARDTPASPLLSNGFVGREGPLELLGSHLGREGERLIGITGVTGVGKTRIAEEAAARAQQEGTLMLWHALSGQGLAEWSTPRNSLSRMMTSAVNDLFGPAAPAARGGLGRLIRLVGGLPTLLVLDDLRNTPNEAALTRLLEECSGLKILYTSVRPQRIPGERVLHLLPLPLPGADDTPAQLRQNPAVRVLLDADALSAADTAAASRICRSLDGLPLALRLASPLLGIYGPRTLLRCLEHDPFGVLDSHARPGRLGVRERLALALQELAEGESETLSLMCSMGGETSVEELARIRGLELTACGRIVDGLSTAGLIHREGPGRFRALNLVRALKSP